MLRKERNSLQVGDWILNQINPQQHKGILSSFDCGEPDLNEYFQEEALPNKAALVGQPYYLHEATAEQIPVALIDLCNDSVRRKSSKQQPGYLQAADVEEAKHYPFLPAVKITRFGINLPFQGMDLGSHTLNMIKKLFITENRTGCRFLTVDAYNQNAVLHFYQKNEFKFFYDKDKDKVTRSMFFDLKRLVLD
jgi:hypothetical protein